MDLKDSLAPQIDAIVETLTRGEPRWIKVIFWIGRLENSDASPAPADIRLNRIVSWAAGEPIATYGKAFGLSSELEEIDDKTAQIPWTQMRLSADRDGERELKFVTDEPRRPFDDSATDPYWRQVHDYLDLNRADVEALVQRLRAKGQLPGVEEPKKRPKLLGYFRPGT